MRMCQPVGLHYSLTGCHSALMSRHLTCFNYGDASASDKIAKQHLYRPVIEQSRFRTVIFRPDQVMTSTINQHGPACRFSADPMCALGAEAMQWHSIVRPASTLGSLSDQPFSDDIAYILPQIGVLSLPRSIAQVNCMSTERCSPKCTPGGLTLRERVVSMHSWLLIRRCKHRIRRID